MLFKTKKDILRNMLCGSQWGSMLLPKSFKILFFVIFSRKKIIRVWSDMKESKCWKNFNLWLNFPFNSKANFSPFRWFFVHLVIMRETCWRTCFPEVIDLDLTMSHYCKLLHFYTTFCWSQYLQSADREAADGRIICDLEVMDVTVEHCGRNVHPSRFTGCRHLTVVIVKKALYNGCLAHPLGPQHGDPEGSWRCPASSSSPVGAALPVLANSWPVHSEGRAGST